MNTSEQIPREKILDDRGKYHVFFKENLMRKRNVTFDERTYGIHTP